MVIWGTAAVVAGALIVWRVVYQHGQKQIEACQAVANVAVSPEVMFGSRPDLASAYLKVAREYPNSDGAAQALLLAAGDLYTEAKYEDAKGRFQEFTRQYPSSPLLVQARLGIAACFDAEGNAAEAMSAYKDLISRYPTDAIVPQAQFALGRLYAVQKEPEQAFNYFEQAAQADPYGTVGSEAGMLAEELKRKFPSLAPPPATAAPASPFQFPQAPIPAPTNSAASPSTNASPSQPKPAAATPQADSTGLRIIATNAPGAK